jgi:phosphotransferase system HPr-like phosphotransfer protein
MEVIIMLKKIQLTTIKDVSQFVNATLSAPCDIELSHGKYVVDAKSMMGVLSLDLTKPVDMTINSDTEPAEFLAQIKEFIIG